MLILASLSPRRRELLGLITTNFATVISDADESFPTEMPPEKVVCALARRKANHVAMDRPTDIVIGADTVVVLDGRILGKPADEADAAAMLRTLSGREHTVYTGVAIVHNTKEEVFFEATSVRFRSLSDEEILAYVESGEPMDKAGSYGVQGGAALFVSGITGDYYTVVGLPVCALSQKLASFDLKK